MVETMVGKVNNVLVWLAGQRALEGGSAPPRWLFLTDVLYLVALAASGVAYNAGWHSVFRTPMIGPIPLGVPWFGAVGAVMVSLHGIFTHMGTWNKNYEWWHSIRPLTGAMLGVASFVFFRALIQAAAVSIGKQTTGSSSDGLFVYYAIAFVIGFSEESFMQLLLRVTEVLIGPGRSKSSIQALGEQVQQDGSSSLPKQSSSADSPN